MNISQILIQKYSKRLTIEDDARLDSTYIAKWGGVCDKKDRLPRSNEGSAISGRKCIIADFYKKDKSWYNYNNE